MRFNLRRAGPFPPMSALLKTLIVILILVLGGGILFLWTWDMPPPQENVEKVLSNDELLR